MSHNASECPTPEQTQIADAIAPTPIEIQPLDHRAGTAADVQTSVESPAAAAAPPQSTPPAPAQTTPPARHKPPARKPIAAAAAAAARASNPAGPLESPLPDRQQRAIDLIVAGCPETKVALVLGIDRKTMYRWRHEDPAYAAQLERQRRERVEAASDRFRAMLDNALDLLARHIKDPYAPTALRAARTVLALAHLNRATDITAPGPKPATGGASK